MDNWVVGWESASAGGRQLSLLRYPANHMSRFICICGQVTRENEEPREASGVLYPVADLRHIEERVSKLASEALRAKDRPAWIKSHFGPQYPTDANDSELVHDILMSELNSKFISVFRCPHCRRLALKSSEDNHWEFFQSIETAG